MGKRNFFRQRESKRYKRKKYKNPYFRGQKKIPWKWILWPTGSVILLVSITSFFLSSDLFRIKEVRIEGLTTIPTETIEPIVWDYLNERSGLLFRASNRFLFDQDTLKETLAVSFAFAQIDAKREGNTLSLVLTEKTSHVLWVSGEDVYLADRQGAIIRTVQQEEATEDIPRFVDLNNTRIAPETTVLTTEELERIESFHSYLQAQQFTLVETRIDRLAGKWMSTVVSEGFQILFDPSGDIPAQALRLETVLREKVPDRSRLEYIDLRFGDHVYIK